MRFFACLSGVITAGLVSIWLLAGCGAAVLNSNPDIDSESPTALLFPEDDDPVNAQLPFLDDELLIRPFPGASAEQIQSVFESLGASVAAEYSEIGLMALAVAPDQQMDTATALAQSDLIESVHKNYIIQAQRVPNDPLYAQQPHLPQIAAPAAWDSSISSDSILIAIVDTGVDTDHPDLAAKVVDGWNVYDGNNQFDDRVGHGTQAAGCAAASSDNATGVTGVAWNSDILAVRATDAGGQSTSRHLAAGILWAAAHGAKVINVSFAPLWSNVVVQAAATSAFHRGSLVIISAGNGGGLTTSTGYPEAVFVGAVTTSNGIAAFSDRGPFVNLVAPGTAIRTTALGGDYGLANGTSFAAPLVSGVAALAWSVNPDLPAFIIRDALTSSAVDLGARGIDGTFGAGLVNAAAAVTAVQETGSVSDQIAPTVTLTSPRNNASLSGRVRVTATAADANGVIQTRLFVDDRPVATDTFAPFEFVLDTALYSAGVHQIAVVAADAAGNETSSNSASVSIVGGSGAADGITFRTPANGAAVSGNVNISANVAASSGLATVEWFVDGEPVFSTTLTGVSSGVSYQWRTSSVPKGQHTITIVTIDSRGTERSASLQLVVR